MWELRVRRGPRLAGTGEVQRERETIVFVTDTHADPHDHRNGTSAAPVGPPEPGGLTSRELQMLLRGLDGLRVVGADVVEVSPAYDHAELTALAAANVVYELLGVFARQASAE